LYDWDGHVGYRTGRLLAEGERVVDGLRERHRQPSRLRSPKGCRAKLPVDLLDLQFFVSTVGRQWRARQIRTLVAHAREEYRGGGAPYGDDDHGFCRWLLARPRLTPSA
jgi:hypothetical protein